MNFTNKYNLPEHICRWCATDEYDYVPSTISVTTLIGPARAWALKQLHAAELTMDYSDMLAVRYGTAIHDSLEKIGVYNGGDFREKRFSAELAGWTITGKPDALIDGVLRDNKSTSVWKYVKREFDDYVKQLSGYRWILHRNGIEVPAEAMIDFFFTDWKRSDALKGGNYPPIRYQEQRIELWDLDRTEEWLTDRLEEFSFALGSIPQCSAEDLWQPPTTYAVYRKAGQSRAVKVFQDKKSAAEFSATLPDSVIECREGKAKRCGYCSAAPFCSQYAEMKAAGRVDE